MTWDRSGVVAVGAFQETVDFDPGPGSVPLASAGLDDAFVVTYATGGAIPTAGAPSAPAPAALALSAPAPSPATAEARLTLTAPAGGVVTVEVLDALGRRVALLHEGPVGAGRPLPLAVDVRALPAGFYVVRAADGAGHRTVRRLVVAR